jgi:hypothetical protein
MVSPKIAIYIYIYIYHVRVIETTMFPFSLVAVEVGANLQMEWHGFDSCHS